MRTINEQRIRFLLFYLSVLVFFMGLPFILSFALGYKFDRRALKFTKAGLIALKTQPQGADIYLNGRLFTDKTPATINEIMPGKYNIRLELDDYYPWDAEVNVEAGKVSLLDKIILFPIRPYIKQLNKAKISYFWPDDQRDKIYYLNQEDLAIYRSDPNGDNFEDIGTLPDFIKPPIKVELSPDRQKLLVYNLHQASVVYLESQDQPYQTEPQLIWDYPGRSLIKVFWHSNSYHIIVVTNKNIEALEAKRGSLPVNLANVSSKNLSAVYDSARDSLYFTDVQRAPDGKFYDNVYLLELNERFDFFKGIIKPKPNE